MDFDSSSKFISSLAKFLQSLCNGYVEFNSGVEVIGHIYLNVDTGKKIDYVLNEKVCKTDENSVTFISNSFHAQPLEKPKPTMKNASTSCHTQQSENIFREQREDQRTEEPTRDSHRATPLKDHSPRLRPSLSSAPRFTQKRPLSHHRSADHRHSVKHMKIDLSMGPDGTLQDRGVVDCVTNATTSLAFTHSTSNPSLTALESTDVQFQKPFSPSAEEAINSQNLAESADVKPELDIDMNIVHVKQEYGAGEGAEDKESCDESQDSKHIYPNVPTDYYYNSNDVKGHVSSEFSNEMLAEYYQSGAGSSARGLPGDPSALDNLETSSPGVGLNLDAPVKHNPSSGPFLCQFCYRTFIYRTHYEGHINSHLKRKSFVCGYCGSGFTYANNLSRHKQKCVHMRR